MQEKKAIKFSVKNQKKKKKLLPCELGCFKWFSDFFDFG